MRAVGGAGDVSDVFHKSPEPCYNNRTPGNHGSRRHDLIREARAQGIEPAFDEETVREECAAPRR